MRPAGCLPALLLFLGGTAWAEPCIAPDSAAILPFVGMWRTGAGDTLMIGPGAWRFLPKEGRIKEAHLVAPGSQSGPRDLALDCTMLDRADPELMRLGQLTRPPWPMIRARSMRAEIRYVLRDPGHLLEVAGGEGGRVVTRFDRVGVRH